MKCHIENSWRVKLKLFHQKAATSDLDQVRIWAMCFKTWRLLLDFASIFMPTAWIGYFLFNKMNINEHGK